MELNVFLYLRFLLNSTGTSCSVLKIWPPKNNFALDDYKIIILKINGNFFAENWDNWDTFFRLIGRGCENFRFRNFAKFSISCFAKFSSNFAKFRETQNRNLGLNFAILGGLIVYIEHTSM